MLPPTVLQELAAVRVQSDSDVSDKCCLGGNPKGVISLSSIYWELVQLYAGYKYTK